MCIPSQCVSLTVWWQQRIIFWGEVRLKVLLCCISAPSHAGDDCENAGADADANARWRRGKQCSSRTQCVKLVVRCSNSHLKRIFWVVDSSKKLWKDAYKMGLHRFLNSFSFYSLAGVWRDLKLNYTDLTNMCMYMCVHIHFFPEIPHKSRVMEGVSQVVQAGGSKTHGDLTVSLWIAKWLLCFLSVWR